MYAGVQFPLAESGDLERELGSRHRAAVGMSQESDAVVLVVSEETGDVSIAERGQLIRKLTPEGLRGLLGELLGRGDIGPPMRKAAVLIPLLLMMFHGEDDIPIPPRRRRPGRSNRANHHRPACRIDAHLA